MLISLQVKNFAIIEQLEVYFKEHLNILTGETGAGKSIIIGSIQAALGGKVSKDMIRTNADYAYVELLFSVENEEIAEALREKEIEPEDGMLILSRKILASGKSISKINGETVPLSFIRQVAALLLDIHGQQEHHSLLEPVKHLELLDRYAKETVGTVKQQTAEQYKLYQSVLKEWKDAVAAEAHKNKDASFLEFAAGEIRAANLKEQEDEELEQQYKRLSNAKTIIESVGAAYDCSGGEGENADSCMNQAARYLRKVVEYDETLQNLLAQAEDITSLLADFNRELAGYLSSVEDSEEEYQEVSERLDVINRLKTKYVDSIPGLLAYAEECEAKLEKYADYDAYLARLEQAKDREERKLAKLCETLSGLRKQAAEVLVKEVKEALTDLNFLDVQFEMQFTKTGYAETGFDGAEFYISTNPGEPCRPLNKVASGGELSRIMLALKAVLADKDAMPTLIFDEIDTGISGRTAQKVSEKMVVIAKKHQLLCITHLPQIASMADEHFVIEKVTDGQKTTTRIVPLSKEDSVKELARMLSGAETTETVLSNAAEMKELAAKTKKY